MGGAPSATAVAEKGVRRSPTILLQGDEALPIAVKCKNYLDALKTAKANIKTYDKPTAGPTVQVEVVVMTTMPNTGSPT